MSEFNPTKKDLFTIESLILDIKAKKSKLVNRKIKLQNSLSHTSAEMRKVALKSKRWKELKTAYENINHEFNSVELEIKSINDELGYKNKLKLEVEHHVKSRVAPGEDAAKILDKLRVLKQEYTDFAKDRTRVASLRVMANEVITKIDNIIKIYA